MSATLRIVALSEMSATLGTHPWPDDLTVVDSLPNGDEFIAIKALAEWPKIDAVRVVVNPD